MKMTYFPVAGLLIAAVMFANTANGQGADELAKAG
ncbi:MAG: hypothetical protein ACI9R7_001374 [Lysobacterales bacterium]|jgi:hypothetical protein